MISLSLITQLSCSRISPHVTVNVTDYEASPDYDAKDKDIRGNIIQLNQTEDEQKPDIKSKIYSFLKQARIPVSIKIGTTTHTDFTVEYDNEIGEFSYKVNGEDYIEKGTMYAKGSKLPFETERFIYKKDSPTVNQATLKCITIADFLDLHAKKVTKRSFDFKGRQNNLHKSITNTFMGRCWVKTTDLYTEEILTLADLVLLIGGTTQPASVTSLKNFGNGDTPLLKAQYSALNFFMKSIQGELSESFEARVKSLGRKTGLSPLKYVYALITGVSVTVCASLASINSNNQNTATANALVISEMAVGLTVLTTGIITDAITSYISDNKLDKVTQMTKEQNTLSETLKDI